MVVEDGKVKSHAQVRRKIDDQVQGQLSKALKDGQKITQGENVRYNELHLDVAVDMQVFTRNELSVSIGITKHTTCLVYVSNYAVSACRTLPPDQTPERNDTWDYTVCCPCGLHSHNVIFDPRNVYVAHTEPISNTIKWWTERDLNPRPPACKAGILPVYTIGPQSTHIQWEF